MRVLLVLIPIFLVFQGNKPLTFGEQYERALKTLCARKPNVQEKQDLEQAKKELNEAHQKGDYNGVSDAIKKIAKVNNTEAVKVLVEYSDSKVGQSEDLYWLVSSAFASFTAKGALEEVAKYILRHKGRTISTDVMFLLQGNVSYELIHLLRNILKEGNEDLKLMAIDRFVATGNMAAVKDLIDALNRESSDTAVNHAIFKALRDLTGQDAGKTAKDWENWFKKGDIKIVKHTNNDNKTGTILDEIDITRKVPIENLQNLDKGFIVVLTAGQCKCGKGSHDYDYIQKVLTKMQIPYTIITKQDLEDGKIDLRGRLALISNCTRWKGHCICPTCKPGVENVGGMRAFKCVGCDKHDMYEHKLSDKAVQKISDFVVGGGYLVAEDWNLEEIVLRAFPGVLGNLTGNDGKPIYGKSDQVPIRPFWGNAHHPYLQKMFFKPIKEKEEDSVKTGLVPEPEVKKVDYDWQIDDDSPILTVNSHLVRVLLTSPKLSKDFNGFGAVALTFGVSPNVTGGVIDTLETRDLRKMRGGRVLFALSHFGKQKSKDDELTLHNMLLNFLLEASERYHLNKNKK